MNDAEEISSGPVAAGEVGLVEARDFVHTQPFTFESGQTLPGFTLRYETYGRLNAARDNTVLVCHALSGDHHCAGIHALTDPKPGWWNNFIGPGKAVDTTPPPCALRQRPRRLPGLDRPVLAQPGHGPAVRPRLPVRHHPRHGAGAETASAIISA